MKRDTNINIRCRKDLKTNLEDLANEGKEPGQNVSLSDYVNVVLTKHVESKQDNQD